MGPGEPPIITPPPVYERPVSDSPPASGQKAKGLLGLLGAAGVALAKFGSALLKIAYPLFKILKSGKILMTSSSMLLSVWFYSLRFGWSFALGFVLSIFVHEMGHVLAARMQGVPVTAPLFIPGFGAMILQKRSAQTAWGEAVIGIAGPVAGMLAGLVCLGIYGATGNALFLGLAYTGFLINLFNLTPMYPLDGGWIVGSISPYLWIIGMVGLGIMFVSGFLRNPLILILILMSIPRVFTSLRSGKANFGSEEIGQATSQQRWIMGGAYIGLCTLLAFLVAETHIDQTPPVRPVPRTVAYNLVR